MNKKRHIISFIILALTLLFVTTMTGCEMEEGMAHITDLDYRAVVVDEPGCEGKVVVTERITFDIYAPSPSYGCYEIWRDLSEEWIDGVHKYYKVKSVKQILPDGTAIPWAESPKLYWDDYDYVSPQLGPGKWFHSPGPYNEYSADYECVFFYLDNVYRDQMTFEIEYELYNAVLRYGDCADLYITMFEGVDTKKLESFHGEILIPNKDMPQQGGYDVLSYGTEEGDFFVAESADANPGYYTFYFDLTEDQLSSCINNDFIEIEIVSFGAGKHAFAEYASHNDWYDYPALNEIWEENAEYHNEIENAKRVKTMAFIACIVIAVTILITGFKSIADLKKKYPFYSSEEVTETYRGIPNDLDPKFAAALVFAKDKKPKDDGGVFSALLLSLARKGYVDIQEFANNDVLITLLEDPNRPKPVFAEEPPPMVPTVSDTYANSLFDAETPVVPQPAPSSIPIDDYEIRENIENSLTPPPVAPANPYTTRGAFVSNPYHAESIEKPDPFATRRESPLFGEDNAYYHSRAAMPKRGLYPTEPQPTYESPYTTSFGAQDNNSSAFPEAHMPPAEPEVPAYTGPDPYAKYAQYSGYNQQEESPQVKSAFPFLERAEAFRPAASTIMYTEPEYVDSREALTPGEELYLNMLKRHTIDNCIAMEILQRRISTDYSYTRDFARDIDKVVIDCGINMGYFQKANWTEPRNKLKSAGDGKIALGIGALIANAISLLSPWQMLYGGYLIVSAASFITGIYVKKQAHKYVLLTQCGEAEYRKWRGLYNFLNSDTLIKDKEFIELPLWEKYLVYATAFDIAEKVIEAIKIRCPEQQAQTKTIVNSPYTRSHRRLRSHSRSFRSSVHRGRTGSYGGYGSGGRGGMGGGGGH